MTLLKLIIKCFNIIILMIFYGFLIYFLRISETKQPVKKNPKTHSLTAFFPNHKRSNEIPARQNDNALRNRSNSWILHDQRPPATQTNTNANHADFFFVTLLLGAIFPLRPPPTRKLRVWESPRAISPARELKGSGRILRLNATVEASWRIFRLDGWDQPRLLAHGIVGVGCDCERRREIGLRMEIGNERGWSEIEKG